MTATQDPHVRVMRQVSAAQQVNNEQIHTLATSVERLATTEEKLAEKLDGFVASMTVSMAVVSKTLEVHAAAIADINRREDERQKREEERQRSAAEHRFTVSNNAVSWLIGGMTVLFGLIGAISLVAQHWK